MSKKRVHFGTIVTKPESGWKRRTRKKDRRMKCELCLTMNPKNAIKCKVCGKLMHVQHHTSNRSS